MYFDVTPTIQAQFVLKPTTIIIITESTIMGF